MTTRLRRGYSLSGAEPGYVPQGMSVDEKYMSMALAEAELSAGDASPNPKVGCVIVQNDTIIARAATEAYGGRHAEAKAMAMVKGRDRLHGATAYVTLEPCCHRGKQPPCAYGLIEAGVRRVVVAIKDPNPKVAGGGIAALQQAGVAVEVGVLANEAKAWHLPFLLWHTRARPCIAGKWAQSIDGCLADDEGRSFWLTGKEARAYGHRLRHRYDAIMVGAGTVLADAPKLTVRDYEPILRQPTRIVVDPSGRLLSPDLSSQQKRSLKATTYSADALTYTITSAAAIARYGEPEWLNHVIGLPDPLTPSAIVTALGDLLVENNGVRRPLQSVYMEGGARLLSWFAAEGLLDCLHTFICPALIGGTQHKLRFSPKGTGEEASSPLEITAIDRYTLLALFNIGNDIVAESVAPGVWQDFAGL